MPLVTRQAIRQAIGEDAGWLIKGASTSSGSTTTVIDNGPHIYASVRTQHIRARSVVSIVESGHASRGERRYATGEPDSAGTITVSPAFSNTIGSSVDFEVWRSDGPHPDQLDRFIDRALAELCWFWRPEPLTVLRSGDMEEDLTVDSNDLDDADGNVIWTGTTVTPSQLNLDPPDEFARRVLRLAATGALANSKSVFIDVDPDERGDWRIAALCRALGATADAGAAISILLRDETADANITPQESLAWTRRGWGLVESDFTIPDDCNAISIILQITTSGTTGDWAWLQVWPKAQTAFSLPRRIASKRHVGSIFQRVGTRFGEFKRDPWTGTLERRDVGGRGVRLELSPAPGTRSLWYYERASYPALRSDPAAATDDDNTTWCPLEWIKTAALLYAYQYLDKRDRKEEPDRWAKEIADTEALLLALQADYGAEPMITEDSPKPRYRALSRL